MFWGFPLVINEEAPIYEHLLMVAEDEFDTFWEARADWMAFEKCPAVPFNVYIPDLWLPG